LQRTSIRKWTDLSGEKVALSNGPVKSPSRIGVSPEPLGELGQLMAQAGADEGRFCSYLKIKSIAELEASRFEAACAALLRKFGKGVAP
jgi:hypothetical protein